VTVQDSSPRQGRELTRVRNFIRWLSALALPSFPGETVVKSTRRKVLHLAVGAAALPAASRFAWAQTYPARPVRVIMPFAAGGAGDILARLMGEWLSDRLGQPFVVENRPGGGSNVGTEAVVRAPADGYTLLVAGSYNVINASLHGKLTFDFVRDIAPVANLIRSALVMVVNPSVPANTVGEFIAYAKANSSRVSFASAGRGSGPHLGGELFKMMAGIDMVHVPYRSTAPAFTDLLGGQVQVMFPSVVSAMEHVRAGRLRALAVTTATRWDALPDLPTVAESVPGYESIVWFGICAPKATPASIIETLNKEINAGLAASKIKARIADLGGVPFFGSPADFRKFITDETEKWGKVIRAANIKPE
jgi:tripartite-type tricarboxylate transporter receptor subunit TctC